MDLGLVRERLRFASAPVLGQYSGQIARSIRRGDLFLLIGSKSTEEMHLALDDASSDMVIDDHNKMTRIETIMLQSMNVERMFIERQLFKVRLATSTNISSPLDCLISIISSCHE